MKTYTLIKSAALTVPAAALMLGSSQAGTSVGINFQGSAYGTVGKVVTTTAFGIGTSDWFSSVNPALASGSLTATPSNGGSFGVSWSAQGVWTSWAAPVYMPSDYAGYPGDTEVYWGNLYGPYQVNLSGLAAQFPNGYVLQAIAADDGGGPQIAPISVTDAVTTETLTYTVRGTFSYNPAAGLSISTPTTNLYTSDTLTLNGPSDGTPRSWLAGFIITDKPVVTVPPKGVALVSGGTITMNAGAVGVAPLSYQWRKGGVDISGATSATYTKSLAEGGDSGDYDVVMTNLYGTATSPVAAVAVAVPATVTWDADTGTSGAQDGDGIWTSANWWDGAGAIAWSNLNLVTFGAGGTGNHTVTLPSAVIAGSLTFNANYSVSGSGSITLNSPAIAATSNATLSVPLLGTSGLTKSGAGTLTLNGVNTFSGGLTVNDGKVVAANGAVPATGAVTVNTGGTLSLTDAAYANVPGTLNLIGGTVSMDGATQNAHNYTGKTLTMQGGTLTSANGPAGPANDGGWGNFVINNSTVVVSGSAQSVISCTTLQTTNGASFTVNDAVAGAGTDLLVSANLSAGALVKTGLGTMELTAANTYTGNTTVTAGTLQLGTTGSIGSSPTLTVATGATLDVSATAGLPLGSTKTLTGGGTVLGAVTANGGKITSTGSLSVTSLTMNSSSTLDVVPGTSSLTITASDGINTGVTGSTMTVNVGTSPITTGMYHLVQYSGTILGEEGFAAFMLGTTPAGDYTYDLVQNGTFIDLVVAPLAKLWTGAVDSEWSTAVLGSPKNWKAGSNESDFLTSDDVLFDDSSDSTTVSINTANVSPNSVLFSNITKSYTLQGNRGITGSTNLTKNGAGALTLNNSNSFTGAVFILGGTLTVASVADGGFDSSLGAGIEIALGGGTLAYTGITSGTDRALYLDADGTLEVTAPGTILTLSGMVSGSKSFTKAGAGILAPVFENTYTGATRINAGTLSIATLADGGIASPLGQSSNAAANLVLGGGTLNYTGATATSNRGFTLSAATTSTIVVTDPAAILTLTGSETGTGSLVKTGSGTLAIPGTSTMGGLTVSAGTLSLTDTTYANVPGTLNIIGGTVSMDGITQNAHNYVGKILTMQGGTLTSINGVAGPANDGGYGNFIINNSTVVVSGSAQSVISCTTLQTTGGASFTVNDAVAGPGTDLLVSANISAGALFNTGLGTMELTAANTYTGNTTVTEGTLILADNARLTFVIADTDGSCNKLTGAGTVALNGDFAINTGAVTTLTTGTWQLENVTTLTGAYGTSFTVMDPDGTVWTDAGSDKWTKTAGTKAWTFDETTGTLTLALAAGYTSWIGGFGLALADQDPTDDPDGDGVNNLIEYALAGRNPAVADGAAGTFTDGLLSFAKRADGNGITYAIQVSDDLGTDDLWTAVTPTTNTTAEITWQMLPVDRVQRFARLFVTIQ